MEVQSRFVSANEVAEILQVSISTAYRIIREMNAELEEQGKITLSGKVSRRYFEEKTYI